MNRNKVKIRCNPYTKTIEYHRWDDENDEYTELSGQSSLSGSKYTKEITIQNNIQEIFDILQNDYNLGNTGLDIEFEGTSDDYNDVRDALKAFCSEYNIAIYKGEYELANASEILDKINLEYCILEQYFDENGGDKELKQIISNYQEAVKPSIPICVMGLYSSGKSAFINSLIGKEILPSASKPTTARTYKITAGNKSEIRFIYKGEKIVLTFKNAEYKPNKSGNLEVLTDLQAIINEVDQHTEERHMYHALEKLNSEKYNNDITDVIEVTVPFVNSSLPINEYIFEIYDTPGSDSASHAEHLEVLKKSIMEQTNGLPILVTDMGSDDKASNKELIDTIDKLGDALDKTNTLIVINKADTATVEEIEDVKKTPGIISKWQSNRMFFVSAIIGIGSKKANPTSKKNWVYHPYYSVYKKNYETFIDPKMREDYDEEDDEYKQLYTYNILSDDRKHEYEKSEKDENTLLINSGIHCVEHEITLFARKYALYNKCRKAQEYLDEATKLTQERLKNVQFNLDCELKAINSAMDKKHQEIIDKINRIKAEYDQTSNNTFVSKIREISKSIVKDRKKTLASKINNIWDESATEKDKKSRINHAEKHIISAYEDDLRQIQKQLREFAEDFWNKEQTEYKKRCVDVVMENDDLTQEQKTFLMKHIMKIPRLSGFHSGLNPRKKMTRGFLYFKRIDEKKWKKCYFDNLKKTVMKQSQTFTADSGRLFKAWTKILTDDLIMRMSDFNPSLHDMNKKAGNMKQENIRLSATLRAIKKSSEVIEGLMEYRRCLRNE